MDRHGCGILVVFKSYSLRHACTVTSRIRDREYSSPMNALKPSNWRFSRDPGSTFPWRRESNSN